MVRLPTKTCFFCERPFVFGTGHYDGDYVYLWDLYVCRCCHSTSLNGLGPGYEKKLAAHLAIRRLPLWGRSIDEAVVEYADTTAHFDKEQPRTSRLWGWLRKFPIPTHPRTRSDALAR